MIEDGLTSMDLDREKVGLLLLQLGDPQGSLSKPNQVGTQKTRYRLSKYAVHFLEHISSASFSYLFEVGLSYTAIFSLTLTTRSMHSCSKCNQTVGRGI